MLHSKMRLSNKVCLVTGAARGIGRNIALSMGREGGVMILTDINSDLLNEVAKEFLGENINVTVIEADLSKLSEVKRLVKDVVNKYGRLDIIVNNARAGERALFEDESLENWDLSFDVNLKAPFFLAQAAIPSMPDGGSIITISSISGLLVSQESPSYQISKSALLHLNRCLASYAGAKGIRANAILPGFIVQDEHKERYCSMDPKQKKFRSVVEALHPLSSAPGCSNDIASTVIFLASNESQFITGQSIVIDGGLSIQDPTKVLFSFSRG